MTNIRWAPLIPLIGGFPLGAEAAFERPPEAIYSYDGFASNDSHYVNHQQKTLGRSNIEYVLLDDRSQAFKQVDVVVGTPPCAALSQLNTGKSVLVRGAECAKNDWMYKVFEDGIDLLGAKVVAVENAPALFTAKGKPVADKLFEICAKRGYSLSLYYTSTKFHGIPQDRRRCFAIGWKSNTAPIIRNYSRDRLNFDEFVLNVDNSLKHGDIVINPKITETDGYYRYIKAHSNRDVRDLLREDRIRTTHNYVYNKGETNGTTGLIELEKCAVWCEDNGDKRTARRARHAIAKISKGMGIWDASIHVAKECINAVIGRNLVDTIHPNEDRSLTVREALALMGFPDNFEMLNASKRINHIAQNVPVCTARDICLEIKAFLEGKLILSNSTYNMQRNNPDEATTELASLEAFLN